MPVPAIEKSVNKQVDSYQTYLRYAMENFVKELESIKVSITESVMQDLKKKDNKMDNIEMEKRVKEMVNAKLKVLVEIDFED